MISLISSLSFPVVPLSSLIIEVTGKDKEEINEIIQNAIEL